MKAIVRFAFFCGAGVVIYIGVEFMTKSVLSYYRSLSAFRRIKKAAVIDDPDAFMNEIDKKECSCFITGSVTPSQDKSSIGLHSEAKTAIQTQRDREKLTALSETANQVGVVSQKVSSLLDAASQFGVVFSAEDNESFPVGVANHLMVIVTDEEYATARRKRTRALQKDEKSAVPFQLMCSNGSSVTIPIGLEHALFFEQFMSKHVVVNETEQYPRPADVKLTSGKPIGYVAERQTIESLLGFGTTLTIYGQFVNIVEGIDVFNPFAVGTSPKDIIERYAVRYSAEQRSPLLIMALSFAAISCACIVLIAVGKYR